MIEFDIDEREMPLVSVVTPTVRPLGLDIVRKSLEKQTYKNWEWLIGSPFNPQISEAIWVEDNFEGGYWTLNRIYNKLIKNAHGKIIVSLQDNIYINPEGLQKFVDAIEQMGDCIVSGVGDQYEREGDYGKPEIKIWSDPRRNTNYGSFYECFPQDIEWNFAALSKKLLKDVGGFDEKMDFTCRGVDAFGVMQRLDALGYKSYLDQDNESFTIRHNRDNYGGEDAWNKSHGLFNGEYEKRKLELIKTNQWPRLSYLSGK